MIHIHKLWTDICTAVTEEFSVGNGMGGDGDNSVRMDGDAEKFVDPCCFGIHRQLHMQTTRVFAC